MSDQSEKAKKWIKENKQLLFDKFADKGIHEPDNVPMTFFMAGSPGAGKTEFSRGLINMWEKNSDEKFVKIDADAIRWLIPGYNGSNTDIFKGASTKGVDILYNYVLKNRLNAVMDSTFAFYNTARTNVERALKKERFIDIFYVFQDPLIAWQFTKKREIEEGRSIPIDFFINSFFQAKENVNKIKSIFKKDANLHLVVKDYSNNITKIETYIENVDNYLKIKYTQNELKKKLLNL